MSIRKKVMALCLVIILGNGFVGYTTYQRNKRLVESEQLMELTEKVISLNGKLVYFVKNIENGVKDFVLTGDSKFISQVYKADKLYKNNIDILRTLTSNNMVQQDGLDSLNKYLQDHLRFSLHLIEVRKKEGITSALQYIRTESNKFYNTKIKSVTDLIQLEETALLQKRKLANEKSANSLDNITRLTFVLMTLLTIILAILVAIRLKQSKEKEERILELSLAYKRAGFRNLEKKESAKELILANQELIIQNLEKEKLTEKLLIANQELIKIEIEQKQHIEELEKMMFMISHEVRQPVVHLLGLSNLFDEAIGSSPNLVRIVGYMKGAVSSLDVFTRDLTKHVSKIMNIKKQKKP
jgi:CHASE3 domain sensor protein